MGYRKIELVTDEIYHVYNRGVEKRTIFTNGSDYKRMRESMEYYRYRNPMRLSHFKDAIKNNIEPKRERKEELVSFLAYCLMPNHIHFLLRQNIDGGISEFMNRLANSYTKYFNARYNRTGPLFQGIFKAVRIESDPQLLQVSRYIHLNPFSAEIIPIDKIKYYPWSSLSEYSGFANGFCKKETVLNYFENKLEFVDFCKDLVTCQREINSINEVFVDENWSNTWKV